MPNLATVLQSLNRVNWDFPRSGTDNESVHAIHWFPGNFIPQIPAFLIQILSEPDQKILDPFGGSGTTAIEALKLGRDAVSVDRVTSCVFLAKAKLAAFQSPLSMAAKEKILKATDWSQRYEKLDFSGMDKGINPNLSDWYSPSTLSELRFIWSLIESFDGSDKKILELVFSDLLFAVASTAGSKTSGGKTRRHHWGWVADNVRPKSLVSHDAIAGFISRLNSLPDQLNFTTSQAKVLQGDARELPMENHSVDAIVTSPPYVSVIDYVRANRMLYLWMGWTFDSDREAEIGARYKRQRKKSRVIGEYLDEMDKCWDECTRVLKPGGYCAIVLGESRAFPGVCNQALSRLGDRLELVWGPTARTPIRRRVADRAARGAEEVVAVYRKQ